MANVQVNIPYIDPMEFQYMDFDAYKFGMVHFSVHGFA